MAYRTPLICGVCRRHVCICHDAADRGKEGVGRRLGRTLPPGIAALEIGANPYAPAPVKRKAVPDDDD